MTINPGFGMADVPTAAALGPKGAPFSRTEPVPGDPPVSMVTVRAVEILRLQPGDRLLVHADGDLGLGGGGAYKIGQQLNALLKLDELGFDVPVVVTAPGLRVEVLRPS